jgi:hypothetical protein
MIVTLCGQENFFKKRLDGGVYGCYNIMALFCGKDAILALSHVRGP